MKEINYAFQNADTRPSVPPYIFPLNPDYVAARSLGSLRSNKAVSITLMSRKQHVIHVLISPHPIHNKKIFRPTLKVRTKI